MAFFKQIKAPGKNTVLTVKSKDLKDQIDFFYLGKSYHLSIKQIMQLVQKSPMHQKKVVKENFLNLKGSNDPLSMPDYAHCLHSIQAQKVTASIFWTNYFRNKIAFLFDDNHWPITMRFKFIHKVLATKTAIGEEKDLHLVIFVEFFLFLFWTGLILK